MDATTQAIADQLALLRDRLDTLERATAPYFNRTARVFHSSHPALVNNTVTALAFTSEVWDTASMHDNASNTDRLVAPVAGKYLIVAQVGFAANATGYRAVSIRNSGGGVLAASLTPPASGDETILNVSTVWDLAAADYVRIFAYQNSGGSLALGSNPVPIAVMHLLP